MAGYQTRTGRGGGIPAAAPASLANLTSGTTFAAAARQAELNAARANKQKAQEAEGRIEVPDIEPLSLGALKFTKNRRGYALYLVFPVCGLHELRFAVTIRLETTCFQLR